jgi:hypothetical protein
MFQSDDFCDKPPEMKISAGRKSLDKSDFFNANSDFYLIS